VYNTLHTISWKSIALTKAPNEVSEMIENLSTILKYTLSNSNGTVLLEEEIYYTMCYLHIQSVRYRNKFTVNWTYDDKLANVRIMKLVLQPLIENSIYHGIKEKEGSGTISIKIVQDHFYLKIWLVDDGLGIVPEKLQEIRTNRPTFWRRFESSWRTDLKEHFTRIMCTG
jgi:two-component system sensor histidine kinase YesM